MLKGRACRKAQAGTLGCCASGRASKTFRCEESVEGDVAGTTARMARATHLVFRSLSSCVLFALGVPREAAGAQGRSTPETAHKARQNRGATAARRRAKRRGRPYKSCLSAKDNVLTLGALAPTLAHMALKSSNSCSVFAMPQALDISERTCMTNCNSVVTEKNME